MPKSDRRPTTWREATVATSESSSGRIAPVNAGHTGPFAIHVISRLAFAPSSGFPRPCFVPS